jgi:hypothetical protein
MPEGILQLLLLEMCIRPDRLPRLLGLRESLGAILALPFVSVALSHAPTVERVERARPYGAIQICPSAASPNLPLLAALPKTFKDIVDDVAGFRRGT